MTLLKLLFLFIILLLFTSCKSSFESDNLSKSANSADLGSIDLKEKRTYKYNKDENNWKEKEKVDKLLSKLASKEWSDRQDAQTELYKLVDSSKIDIFNYMFLRASQESDPEIIFRANHVKKLYFENNIYDPDRKKGFIGLQLGNARRVMVDNQQYMPLLIVFPQIGFPGRKAGIKKGDLILAVDNHKCNKNFNLNDFIKYIAGKKPKTEITLLILRNKKSLNIKVKLTARPTMVYDDLPKKSKKEQFEKWKSKYENSISR